MMSDFSFETSPNNAESKTTKYQNNNLNRYTIYTGDLCFIFIFRSLFIALYFAIREYKLFGPHRVRDDLE